MTLDLKELDTVARQYFLQHVVAPRPLCFASTIDRAGNANLSPFSFFNLFSANPPVVIFSPARRVRDSTTKHTLQNALEVPQVVINIVSYDMVQQASLASTEYPKGVDEFVKAGFTKERATVVAPPMVKESRAKLECSVMEVKSLGEGAGAGQLVICEVLKLHLHDGLLDEHKKFIQAKLDPVARLGGDWYCRVTEESLFIVPKPNANLGIGIDGLPPGVRFSKYLTGNHLGMLANVHAIPQRDAARKASWLDADSGTSAPGEREAKAHQLAATLLEEGKVQEAWQVLLRHL